MTFIKRVTLDVVAEKELESLGFILSLKYSHGNGYNTFDVFAQN
jgi:hypothetical protein